MNGYLFVQIGTAMVVGNMRIVKKPELLNGLIVTCKETFLFCTTHAVNEKGKILYKTIVI